MESNLTTLERAISVTAGAALIAVAFRDACRSARGVTAGTTGAGLLARGLTGYCPVTAAVKHGRTGKETREALSGPKGVHIREAVTIARPRAEIYALWRRLENLPRYMTHIERVRVLDGRRSRWTARGPAGTRITWDAEIINEIPGSLIGWRSLPNARVAQAGSIHFHDVRDGATELVVHLQYDPPAGRTGRFIARLLGDDPASQVREDLRRFKQLMETGETPNAGVHASGRRSWMFRALKAWT